MSKKVNRKVPRLRFSEFHGDWTEKKLSEISNKISDGIHSTPKYDENGEYYFINGNNLSDSRIEFDENTKRIDVSEYLKYKSDLTSQTILVSINGTIGNLSFYENEKIVLGKSACYVNLKLEENKFFVFYLLQTSSIKSHFHREVTGATIKNLSLTTIKNTKALFPTNKEQEKIASFLGAVDTRLTQLRHKHEILQTYKRGVMQKIFSQQIRFKGDNGKPFPDWEKKKFSQVFERITRKNKENNLNTLTISAQHGLINQRDFFNKSVSADDLTGYYLLKRGDFAYNKSYSNGYPMGAIKRLKFYEKGVVSTHYICFSTKNEVEAQFYEKYFEGGFLNHELSKIAQEGARNHGLLNMSIVEFFQDVTLDYPTIEEQAKITDFLTELDKKIEAIAKQIDLTEQYKKGLLQKMFV